MYIVFRSVDIGRKVALKLRNRQKVVLGPRFVAGRDTHADFGHAFSNYTYFRPCGWIWFSSVQRAQRLEGEKRRIPGKI